MNKKTPCTCLFLLNIIDLETKVPHWQLLDFYCFYIFDQIETTHKRKYNPVKKSALTYKKKTDSVVYVCVYDWYVRKKYLFLQGHAI